MNKVTLTPEEAQWFSRNVIKMISLLEAQGQKDPTILDRSTYKTLKACEKEAVAASLVEKLALPSINVLLTRKQKLIVKELILSVNKTLTDRILPEYTRRGGHEKYIEMGKEKSKKLEVMARKFK